MEIRNEDMGCVLRTLGQGHAKAPVEVRWYGTQSCQVAVKRYAQKMECECEVDREFKCEMKQCKRELDMKRKLGLASMTHFPSLLRLIGWVRLVNGDLGIVSELHDQSL
jgi:hypothetical protein